jgi:hypothetical protein
MLRCAACCDACCLQEGTRTGAIDPTTAASLSTALISGTTTAVDALSAALGMGPADTTVQVPGSLTQDFEFSAVELVRPTRMNKVYLVFACSVLEQDLLFVVYNIPTVGICRAEQRAKACQKLGIPYSDWGGLDYNTDGPSHSGYSGPKPQGGTGAAAAAAAVAAYASAAQQQQQQSRKRPQPAWGDGMMLPDGLKGSDMAAAAAAAAAAVMAAGGDPNMAIPVQLDGSYMAAQQQGMDAAQLSMLGALPAGLVPSAAAAAGGGGGVSGGGAAAGTPLLSGAGAAAGNAAVGAAVPCSRAALRAQLQQEYEQAGLTRRLTSLDLKVNIPSSSIMDSLVGSDGLWGQAAMLLHCCLCCKGSLRSF